MIPLRCCVKKYEWGKKGMDSAVARFLKNQMPGYEVDSDSPFAEVFILNFIINYILFSTNISITVRNLIFSKLEYSTIEYSAKFL